MSTYASILAAGIEMKNIISELKNTVEVIKIIPDEAEDRISFDFGFDFFLDLILELFTA